MRLLLPPPASHACTRRGFLRQAGVALALPFLPSLIPLAAKETERQGAPRRMIAICNNLGLIPEQFFPAKAGRDYVLTPTLAPLAAQREQFTVFGGVSHPFVDGGHPADNCFLTAAPHPGNGGFRNTISLDQFAAQRIGHLTRYPSLTLGVNVSGQRSLSWTGAGVLIPCETKAATVYKRLFLQGTKAEIEAQKRRLALGQSIMDTVGDQLRGVAASVGVRDRERLDQYATGVRELEQRLEASKAWEDRPKPVVSAKPPIDPVNSKDYMEKTKLMYQLARLALETDSTRLVTIMLDSVNSPVIDVPGATISDAYHSLSHHGKNPGKVAQLSAIDREHMRLLGVLMSDLQAVREADGSLLDHTMILYGSNLGNASTHVTTNLPVLLAGGGFRHGQHLAFDQANNQPLANLFVTMLHRLGIESDRFASSTGPMSGITAA